jgi:flagellar basal body rod protein FlgG
MLPEVGSLAKSPVYTGLFLDAYESYSFVCDGAVEEFKNGVFKTKKNGQVFRRSGYQVLFEVCQDFGGEQGCVK